MTDAPAPVSAVEDAPKKLTRKQQVFVNEYLRSFNATQAAVTAGYSERSAYAIGSQNLRKHEIAEAISQRLAASHMSADEALNILADHARCDIGEFMDVTPMGWSLKLTATDENGETVKNPKTRLIKKIKQKVTTIEDANGQREIIETEIELHDPQAAIDKILRVAGKFIERKDITSGGKEIRFAIEYADDNPGKTTQTA